MKAPGGLIGAALLLAACAQAPVAGERPHPVELVVAGDRAIAEVDPRFLSVALDASQLVGGHFWSPEGRVEAGAGTLALAPFDFARPRLLALTRALGPAYLRLGGSEADTLVYDLDGAPTGPLPPGATRALTRARWSSAMAFATGAGLEVIFTLAAGPPSRDASGRWRPQSARALLRLAADRQDPVVAWELGNEVNGFELLHGLGARVSGEQYARDYLEALALVSRTTPGARLLGPASAFWPVLGELRPVLPRFLQTAGASVQGVSWHYYPQQSRRCPVAVRRASLERLMEPAALDEVARWAGEVAAARARWAPQAELWMTETGNAQCGGEPGVSDAFAGSFWWLDELGQLASLGVRAVARQTLVGSDYGLLDEASLDPRPDYWLSVLWKRRMGTRVLRLEVRGSPRVRAYAHCAPEGDGAVAIAWLNLDPARPATLRLPGLDPAGARLEVLTARSLGSRELQLNGRPLRAGDDGTLPALDPPPADGPLAIPARSLGFLTLPQAHAAACR